MTSLVEVVSLENADVAADDLGFAETREQIVGVQHVRRG